MIHRHSLTFKQVALCASALLLVALSLAGPVSAGCPFDDGSCQEYCSQQGCNMGYCGHFAWIQCICRKCGDEWNWYDKVRYNPDKTVNQTELDSLKLNGSAPIILTNSGTNAKQSSSQQVAPATAATAAATTATTVTLPSTVQQKPQQAQPKEQQRATLTTLLIPDLSDGSKLDLNDIPDENSEKFLEYLAKNHEKLAQATSQDRSANSDANGASGEQTSDETSTTEEPTAAGEEDEEATSATPTSTTATSAEPTSADDVAGSGAETVEIVISSSNNGRPQQQQQQQPQEQSGGAVTRLLKMAVMATEGEPTTADEEEQE